MNEEYEDESYEDTPIGMAEEMQREQDDGAMDDAELQSIISAEIDDAISYIDSDLSPLRAQATQYYRGDLFGNEVDGNSQAVSTEVRDVVNAMLPSVMKTMFSSEKIVEFMPRGPEDESAAEQTTDYINYIIQQDNDGFNVLYSTFKDALIRKCGVIKTWWDEKTTVKIEEYSGLDEQTLQVIQSEPGAVVTVIEQYDDPSINPEMLQPQVDPATGQPMLDKQGNPVMPPVPQVFDVTVKRVTKDGRACVAAIPLEEFLLSRNARSIEDSSIVSHRKMATVAELVEMGYDEDEIQEYITSNEFEANDEYLRRRAVTTTLGMADESNNPMMQRVLYIESWIKVDYDSDGLPELRKICTMGDGHTIVNNEPADFIPFADFPCDPEPHTSPLEAMSIFDYTKDLQEIKSDILRNTLDSLAQSIHPRTGVVEGQVNMDDVLNNETGAVVRMRAPGMVQPLTTPFVGREAFSMLEYMDQVKEDRTGMSKASMGLNADALQSSTKAAVAATVTASQMRIELTTRILANGMKKLFKNLLHLVVTRQDRARVVRLRNQWVQIDPRLMDSSMDVSINVALGTGDTAEKMGALQMIMGIQREALMQMGPQNPLVTPAQFSYTVRKMVELAGFRDASQFFNAVPANYAPPPKEDKPSPEEVLAQVQAQSIQADIQKKAAELQLDQEKMMRSDDRERDRIESDMMLRAYELQLKYGTQVDVASIKAMMERDREAMKVMQPQAGVQ